MTLNLMKKSRRKYPLRAQTSPEMNNILLLHSEWLEKEGLKKEARECRKQAMTFKQKKDWRQTEGFSGRRRDERQVESNINC